MHKFNPSIIREYDIRGLYDQTLFDDDAYHIGRRYGKTVGAGSTISVGRDGRLSTPALHNLLIKGLLESGVNVIDIGVCPTPMTYFAVFFGNLDGGIMITGSHNPGTHNGFKLMLGKQSLHGVKLKEMAAITDYIDGTGKLSHVDITSKYVNQVLRAYYPTKRFLVGWDPGNGAAGEIVEHITKGMPGVHLKINTKIDGNFPNHHPDPISCGKFS